MSTCYVEVRTSINTAILPPLAADIAVYLQARQHLGKTVVISNNPLSLMCVVRKQWLKLARNLQRERASTVNAEKILRLTSAITHMHRMRFAAKPPEDNPGAHVFFVQPQQLSSLPLNTYSLFITQPLTSNLIPDLIQQLPNQALLVDYAASLPPAILQTLTPKYALQAEVLQEWAKVRSFLKTQHIAFEDLLVSTQSAADDALDTLLGVSHEFLRVASAFQRILELSQPAQFDARQQRCFDLLILFAYRIQALSPQASPLHRFTHDLSDDPFFLHDYTKELTIAESLSLAIREHAQAGRTRLARALLFLPTTAKADLLY